MVPSTAVTCQRPSAHVQVPGSPHPLLSLTLSSLMCACISVGASLFHMSRARRLTLPAPTPPSNRLRREGSPGPLPPALPPSTGSPYTQEGRRAGKESGVRKGMILVSWKAHGALFPWNQREGQARAVCGGGAGPALLPCPRPLRPHTPRAATRALTSAGVGGGAMVTGTSMPSSATPSSTCTTA